MNLKKLVTFVLVILVLGAGAYLGYRAIPQRTNGDRSFADIKERGFIRVASNLTEYPWGGYDPSTGQATGGEAEIARLISRELGLLVEFIDVKDPAAAVTAGVADISFYKHLEASEGTTRTDGYFATGLTLAVRVNNEAKDVNELRGRNVAYVESLCCSDAKEIIEGSSAVPIKYNSIKAALEDIEKEKVSGGVLEMSETAWYVRHHPLLKLVGGDEDNFVTSGKSFAALIKSDKAALLEEINKAIGRVRNRNEFEDIISRWYLFKI